MLSDEAKSVEKMCGRSVEDAVPPSHASRARRSQRSLQVEEFRPATASKAGRKLSLQPAGRDIVGVGRTCRAGATRAVSSTLSSATSPTRGDVSGSVANSFEAPQTSRCDRAGMGISLMPAERKTEGLLLRRSTSENMGLAALRGFCRPGASFEEAEERLAVEHQVDRELQIVTVGDVIQPVRRLSGGNQQKVLIGKWLLTDSEDLAPLRRHSRRRCRSKGQIYKIVLYLAKRAGRRSSTTAPSSTS